MAEKLFFKCLPRYCKTFVKFCLLVNLCSLFAPMLKFRIHIGVHCIESIQKQSTTLDSNSNYCCHVLPFFIFTNSLYYNFLRCNNHLSPDLCRVVSLLLLQLWLTAQCLTLQSVLLTLQWPRHAKCCARLATPQWRAWPGTTRTAS